MIEVSVDEQKSFIGAWFLDEIDVCDELLDYFEKSPGKVAGQIGNGQVDKDIKDSIDLQIGYEHFTDPPIFRYLNNLTRICQKYVEKYQASAALDGWGIAERFNIQHYPPGGGFKGWHCERWGKGLPSVHRHLTFLTYLNDVADAGGTEFLYQGITIQPKKGLTAIFPADWTHYHRGVVSPTQDKYVVTGWLSFM